MSAPALTPQHLARLHAVGCLAGARSQLLMAERLLQAAGGTALPAKVAALVEQVEQVAILAANAPSLS